jgi:hypothetical protein
VAVDRFLSWSIEGLVGEMKSHPWTTLAALVALGVAGYNYHTSARAAELVDVKNTVTEILAGQIEVRLIDARVRYCEAARSDNTDVQIFYRNLTADYAERYRKTTGRMYSLPSCNEV